MVPDSSERTLIDMQLESFEKAKGLFGFDAAKLARNKKTPAEWWDSYGDECPELQKFAIKILSLTCSSSGCERNWSAFEMVHTKRRNRLHHKKMNDLVFVMQNLKLKDRKVKRPQEECYFEDLSSDDEWIVEEGDNDDSFQRDWLSILEKGGLDKGDEEVNIVEEIESGEGNDPLHMNIIHDMTNDDGEDASPIYDMTNYNEGGEEFENLDLNSIHDENTYNSLGGSGDISGREDTLGDVNVNQNVFDLF